MGRGGTETGGVPRKPVEYSTVLDVVNYLHKSFVKNKGKEQNSALKQLV